jgi:long-chain fatty acid transport protein
MKLHGLKKLASMGLLASVCLFTNEVEAVLASVKSTAMAAAVVAHPLDALAGAYNPAGMVEVGDRFDVGGYWVHDVGRTIVSNNASPFAELVNGSFDSMRTQNFYAADFGINKTFCTEICGQEWEWSLGLVAYDRNFQKTTYKQNLPLFGTSHAGLEYAHVTIAPTLAVKLNECHSIGIAFNVQVERFKVNGLENFEGVNPLTGTTFSVDPAHVTNHGYDYSTGFTPTLGWLWHINDSLTFGLTYQPKTSMPKLKKYKGFLAQHGRLDIPQKIGAGIAWNFLPCATVAFDIEHIDWNQIKALKNNAEASDGSLNQLGASNGPGFGFRNQLYYRVGLEYQLYDCLTLRAGYRWVRVPFKKSSTATNILLDDCVESFVTCGATWNWDECNEISGLFAYGFEKSVSGTDSIPIFLGGGDVKLKERKFAVGISWGHNF